MLLFHPIAPSEWAFTITFIYFSFSFYFPSKLHRFAPRRIIDKKTNQTKNFKRLNVKTFFVCKLQEIARLKREKHNKQVNLFKLNLIRFNRTHVLHTHLILTHSLTHSLCDRHISSGWTITFWLLFRLIFICVCCVFYSFSHKLSFSSSSPPPQRMCSHQLISIKSHLSFHFNTFSRLCVLWFVIDLHNLVRCTSNRCRSHRHSTIFHFILFMTPRLEPISSILDTTEMFIEQTNIYVDLFVCRG